MTVLRIQVNNELLIDNDWFLINGTDDLGSGQASIKDALALDGYDSIEVYLAPFLATVFKVDISHISDRKITDELLLGLVEDNLVEEVENCKPLLMRLSDGGAFVAVLNSAFYQNLIQLFSEHIKLVKFIQPSPYLSAFEDGKWTICLTDEAKYIRTSQFEYYLLDDGDLFPDMLRMMLDSYTEDSIIVYANNQEIINELENKYKLLCKVETEFQYGNLLWNFYNEKSKRFNYKFTQENKSSLIKVGKTLGLICGLYVVFWVVGLGYLVVDKYRLQSQVSKLLTGLIKFDGYQTNLLGKVNDQLGGLAHSKGYYSSRDFVFLMNAFLQNMPEVNQTMIVGVKFSNNTLHVLLNSQFQNNNMDNYIELLRTKRIAMEVTDYASFQSASQGDGKSNNGGGLLDDSDKDQNVKNAQWVVSLHEINTVEQN